MVSLDGTKRRSIETYVSPGGYYVYNLQVTPDSSTLIYAVTDSKIYRALLIDGTASRIGGDVAAQGLFEITPDGRYVLFTGNSSDSNQVNLFRVAISGGESVKLNNQPLAYGNSQFALSHDGRNVFYLSQTSENERDLFVVSVEGGQPVLLSSAPSVGNIDLDFQLAFRSCKDNSHVVFWGKDQAAGTATFYSADLSGAAPVKIATLDQINFNITYNMIFEINSVCTHVVIYAETPLGDNRSTTLYSARLDGGGVVELGQICDVFNLAPNNDSVVFAGQTVLGAPCELFSTPIAGGELTRLNRPLNSSTSWAPITSQLQRTNHLLMTPNGKYVFYLADHDTDNMFELYQAATDGSGVRKVSGPLVQAGNVMLEVGLSPDGKTILYRADADRDEKYELYAAPVGENTGQQLYLPHVEK